MSSDIMGEGLPVAEEARSALEAARREGRPLTETSAPSPGRRR